MNTLATTRMSSKGQVVIPEKIREQMNLKEGVQFIVVGEGDVVILKMITTPNLDTFDTLIQQARKQAKTAGLERTDIERAVLTARERE